MNKNKLIKRKFKELGFDLIGFTYPVIEKSLLSNFKKRYQDDDLPPFVSDDIKSMVNPKRKHPWAESVIVLGISYARSERDDSDGFISRYSRGKDYHYIIKEKIKKGIKFLNEIFTDLKYSFYVDQGPVLEKALAQQAGLGWIGKNTLLINERYGSYLFLGEIFINKKLNYDKMAVNRCGECRRCIENCPTDSLDTPYYLNYRTCRSHLTQVRGILDEEQKKLIGNSIWGCDNCQEVCPYNKDIEYNLHPEFEPKIRGDILKILSYDRKDFPKKWLNSALSWRGMRIIQRNALIAICNLKLQEDKYRDVIFKKIEDPSPIIRYYAYQAYIASGYDLDLIKANIRQEKEIDLDNIKRE